MSIVTRRNKDGTISYFAVIYCGGRSKWMRFSKKNDAKAYFNEIELNKSRGELTSKRYTPVYFEEFTPIWFERHATIKMTPQSIRSASGILKNYLSPFFGSKRLMDIDSQIISRYIAKRKAMPNKNGKMPSNGTINRTLEVLSSIFTKAYEWDYIKTKPFKKIEKLSEPQQMTNYLSEDEIVRFLHAAEDGYKPMFATAIFTGMRLGELLNLKKSKVDMERKVIEVAIGSHETNTTKSKRIRHVPFSTELAPYLDKAMRTKGEYMFPNKNGARRVDVGKAFQRALDKAGIKRHVRFHDLRHTFASHYVMQGGDIYSLKMLGGWSDLKLVERYSHLSPDFLRSHIEKLKFRSGEKQLCNTN